MRWHIISKDENEAWAFLEQLAKGSKTQMSSGRKVRFHSDIHNVDHESEWKNEVKNDITELNNKIDLLLKGIGNTSSHVQKVNMVCSLCGDVSHTYEGCPLACPPILEEQVNETQSFKPQVDPRYAQYNPKNGPHPNFSWKNNAPQNFNQNFNQQPRQNNFNNNRQGNFPSSSNQNMSGESSLEKKIDKVMAFMDLNYQKTESNSKSIAALEKQIGQLAEQLSRREDGKLPSQNTINPTHQRPNNEHVNEVITLRSGKKVSHGVEDSGVHDTVIPIITNDLVLENELSAGKMKEPSKDKGKEKEASPQTGEGGASTSKTTGKAPFPAALVAPSSYPFGKKGPQGEDMLEVFRQVKINLPLLDSIKQISAYAKFLKDLCTQKR